MRVTVAISTLLAAISLGFYGQSTVEAAAVTAGAPEHLVAGGGECVRLFHSKGDVGCRSASSKDMAPVFPIESKDELSKWLEGEKSEDKVVLVLPESLVTADNLKDMGDRIAGLIAYADLKNNVTFTSTTPQGNGSPDAKLNPFSSKKVKWNPDGLGLIDTSISYPIFLLNATYAETFLDRARMNKKKVAGATFTAFMNHYYGPEGMNSIKCLAFKNVYGRRNPKCDPIGGQSSWGIRGDRSANETVVVMTGMDAYAYSQVLVPGANEGASGLAALLGAAQALQAVPDSEFNKQIIFAAFQAEKFGFVGSRRFLSDIKKAKKEGKSFCKTAVKDSKSPFASEFCTSPLHPTLEFTSVDTSSITYAIAVDQVGILGKSGNFSIHVNPKAEAERASALVDAITSAPSAKNKFSKSSSSEALPPTPLLSFVNKGEFGQEDLVGAVIAGYDTSFNGKGVYGSRHDIFENIDVDAVVQASQVLAETVYQLGAKKASDSSLKKIKVDKDTVHSIVRCISMDWRCDFMKNYTKPFVNTMIEYLDLFENAWPVSRSPVSLYSGPMDSDRQPLVIEDATADVTKYLTDFNGTWSDDVNRVNLFPNAYEMFTRSFLAATLGDESATKKDKTCTKSQECEDKALECVHPGVCVKRRAYFHDAYSPGLVRTASVQMYDVVDENMPLWTEPSWSSDVGTYVFPNPGNTVGWIALVVGIVVTAIGGVVSRWLLAGVQKMKLL